VTDFQDSKGATWDVALNTTSIKRVKNTLGIDLLDVVSKSSSVLTTLQEDPMVLVDTLYVVCKEQADARGVSDEAFGCGFDGNAIEAATEALIEGLINFFPPRRREILRKVLLKMTEAEEAAMEEVEKELDKMDAKEMARTAIQQSASGTTSTAPQP